MAKKNLTVLAWVFYLVIVFEIIYMITPFALFYYSAYGPSLNFLNKFPVTAWSAGFFLPHFTETSSAILNALNSAGRMLFLIGFFLFLIGAVQIYFAKFYKKGAVTGGLYKFIRHPQYTAFAIMGLGTLLVWPRYIILLMFVTMLFVYYALARKEERECSEKYGENYTNYVGKTSMFLPGDSLVFGSFQELKVLKLKPALSILFVYVLVLGGSLLAGFGLRVFSVSQISKLTTPNSVTMSVVPMKSDVLSKVVQMIQDQDDILEKLALSGYDNGEKFLNYVVPLEWIIPDLPLDPDKISMQGHHQPADYDPNEFKVLFSKVISPLLEKANGVDILKKARKILPVLVVKLNILTEEVLGIEVPPKHVLWGDILTPLF
ncbi:methyltransferase family protein [Acidobacteriota bacterium]